MDQISFHRKMMQRALNLAEKARGFTAPNPVVGAVIVKNGKIIGEGWHHGAGQPHAEVEAIRSAGKVYKSAHIPTGAEISPEAVLWD